MDKRQLCIDLALCEKEENAIELIKKNNFWDDPKVWRYYGDKENNFSITGNQQSRPEAAITEKIINSVDAVLLSECLKLGIDPESKEAPQSIAEALTKYFKIFNGKLSNITATERSKLADRICLVASGAKSNPCYSIIDKGEGQTPNDMPNTLLSLSESNKLRIPFVQGKFNQGGTGVFQFSGYHNLHFVISKRNPSIPNNKDDKSYGLWGFTIVRRVSPVEGVRSSAYKYLVHEGEIMSFESDSLPIFPSSYPEPYGADFKFGTYIKLYEYQMTGLKTNILLDLYNKLSLLMPSIPLPVRLYERRKGYNAHSYETTLSGLTVRLDEDKQNNLEDGFPSSSQLIINNQKMNVSIYAFKRGKSENYVKKEGVVFAINGQTHGCLQNSFFRNKSVNMTYLADSLLVLVDSSGMDRRSIEDLFMNSRDRLRSCELKSSIEKELTELIRNHPGLKELRGRRRREDIEEKIGDSKPLAHTLEKLIKNSQTLSKLFVQGVRLPNPFKINNIAEKQEFNGKRFPSFFKLKNEWPTNNPKPCPINRAFRVKYKTDVSNDYFDRDKDPGSFILKINGKETSNFFINLWNGIATLNVHLPENVCEADVLKFESFVEDISLLKPFSDTFWVKIDEEVEKTSGGNGGKRKPPASDQKGSSSENISHLGLPTIVEVKKDDWEDYKFNKESALMVKDSGENGYDFFVNVDNFYLRAEQKVNRKISPEILNARYKFALVLIGISLLHDHDSNKTTAEKDNNEVDIYETISNVSKAISIVLLPMIGNLGDFDLDIPE